MSTGWAPALTLRLSRPQFDGAALADAQPEEEGEAAEAAPAKQLEAEP